MIPRADSIARLLLGSGFTRRYFERSGSGSVPGAFGSVIVTLASVYFAAQVLLAGLQPAKIMTISGPDGSDPANDVGDGESPE